jgi:hypothetical protein
MALRHSKLDMILSIESETAKVVMLGRYPMFGVGSFSFPPAELMNELTKSANVGDELISPMKEFHS